jgi:hypothetical protein
MLHYFSRFIAVAQQQRPPPNVGPLARSDRVRLVVASRRALRAQAAAFRRQKRRGTTNYAMVSVPRRFPFGAAKSHFGRAYWIPTSSASRFFTQPTAFSMRGSKKRVVTPVEQGKAVDVRLEVDEGLATNVTAIRLFGLPCPASNTKSRARPTFKSNACRELEEQVAIAVGSRFNHAQYLGAKARIKTFLRQHGYAYADVGGKVFVHRKKRQAELRFTIKRGPKVRVWKGELQGVRQKSIPSACNGG